MHLIVRTQIDAAVYQPGSTVTNETEFEPASSTHPMASTLLVNIHTLFEYDSKMTAGYSQKLDMQRGAVLGLEIQNNANKLLKWSLKALLSGVDAVKIGFVSRVNFKEQGKYVILGQESWKAGEFYRKMSYDIENSFGIIKAFFDLVMVQDDGAFVLVKDPNKLALTFYQV